VTATIVERERVYCMWAGCESEANWEVFDDHEPVGDFCKRHAGAEKKRIEKGAS
jgi:hypothetical protein